MNSTIKSRLFKSFLIVAVIPLLLIGGISYYFISNEIYKQTEEKVTSINTGIKNMVHTQDKLVSLWLESSAAAFTYKLATLGESRLDYDNMVDIAGHHMPSWYIGDQLITNDNTLVDELSSEQNLQATIFMLHNNEFVRVSTNVRKDDGSRILGTILNSGPVYNKIINGQQFLGRADVAGIWEATIYRPIFDKQGKLIGVFVLGRRENEYEIIDAIKKISIGDSGYVFIMDSVGNMIIHPSINGQNVMDLPWIKDIIKNKEGKIQYKFNGQSKIAYYTYYEPWDWYIITGGNEKEIFNNRTKLNEAILFTLITVIGLAFFVAYALSKSFSKPLEELMGVMKETQEGDFSPKLKYVNNDEFGVLNNTFNNMINNISILIGRVLFNSNNLKEASKMLKADINQSREALKGIECGVEALKGYDYSYTTGMSHYVNPEFNEVILIQINQLRFELDEVIVTKNYNSLENIKLKLDGLEEAVLELDTVKEDKNDGENITEKQISYGNKIDNLRIEVQKLKLLLENISSSGNKLDDVALSLDNHINIFKIGNEKELE